jgi:hypothetical protein
LVSWDNDALRIPATAYAQTLAAIPMTTRSQLLVLIILTSSRVFAQTDGLSETTRTEISNFEQKHFKVLTQKYKNIIEDRSDIDILYIYGFELPDSLKKRAFFKNKTFLSYLKVIKGQKKSFLRGQSFALNKSDRRIIIGGQDNQVVKSPNFVYLNKSYEQIINAKAANDNMIFFHISGSNGMVYFGLTDSDIYVYDISKNVTYNLIDFVDHNWDELLIK